MRLRPRWRPSEANMVAIGNQGATRRTLLVCRNPGVPPEGSLKTDQAPCCSLTPRWVRMLTVIPGRIYNLGIFRWGVDDIGQ